MTSADLQRLYLDGRHYDLAYRGDTEDIDFWLGQANRYGGPILELACGTGRVAVPIAKQGHEVTGLDLSGSMLEQARVNSTREGLDIQWVQADMRRFQIGQRFPLIICPSQSISRLLTVDDLEECLSRVREHLAPGGRFIFGVYNPSLEILGRDPGERSPYLQYPHPDSGKTVTVEDSCAYDRATQVLRITLHYRLPDSDVQPTEVINNRMYFPQELDSLMKHNGFNIEAKYGGFDSTQFVSASDHQILVCTIAP